MSLQARKSVARLAVVAGFAALVLQPRSAPGTVAEQRARLPPPAECESEAEGRWKAHVYDDRFRIWHTFLLEVRHVADDPAKLTGTIKVEVWRGGPTEQQPGPCQGQTRYRLHMPAEGTHKDGLIHFWGTRYEIDEVLCGSFPGYNLDHFSGRIDQLIQEFQSVNNDGGNAVNQPTVFRRIGCFDSGTDEPAVAVKPPPLLPKSRSGCSCE